MDEMTLVEKYNHELYHHGTKGMKWGIRRYQNKDGSLTAAGKKRYGTKANFERVQAAKKVADKANSKQAKARRKANERTAAEIAKYRKKAGIKDEPKTDTKPKKKTMSEMSDEELIGAINRKRLEQQYAALNPEKVSKGKQFLNSLKDDILIPTAKSVGKDFAIKKAKDYLGLNDKEDSISALKKEVERLNLQKQIKDLKKPDTEYDDLKKQYDKKKLEKDIENLDKNNADYDELKKRVDALDLERRVKDLEDTELATAKRDAQLAKYNEQINKNPKPKPDESNADDDIDDLDIDKELEQLDFDYWLEEREKKKK